MIRHSAKFLLIALSCFVMAGPGQGDDSAADKRDTTSATTTPETAPAAPKATTPPPKAPTPDPKAPAPDPKAPATPPKAPDAAKPAAAPADPLVDACREAKSAFDPITDADLAAAKTDAVAAVDALDERFQQQDDNAVAWRDYLDFADLKRELSKDAPDLDVIRTAYRRLANDQNEALRYVWFLNAREALFRMLARHKMKDNPKLAADYEKNLDFLATALETEKRSPSPKTRAQIGQTLGWLETVGRAPRLTERIRARFGRPNLHVWCSAGFVDEAVARTVSEPTDEVDCILGTRIRARGTTTGEITTKLVPCDEGGLLEVCFTGNTATRNVGVNGPATIYSTASTDFVAVKRLFVDRDGLSGCPTTSTAQSHSQFTSICTRSRLRIVKRIATKQAYRQKPLGEQIASRHAEARLNRRVDEQLAPRLCDANDSFESNWIRPLHKFRLSPETMQLGSTPDRLLGRILQARMNQIAAPGDPPSTDGEGRLGFQMHESLVNNTASSALGGVFLAESELRSIIDGLPEALSKRLTLKKQEIPWGIEFSQDRPIWVRFAENRIRLGIRAVRIVRGDRKLREMDVTVNYRIERGDDGIVLVRDGDCEVLPFDFAERGEEKGLSLEETPLKTQLDERLAELFKQRIVPEPLTFEGEWEKAGPLVLTRLEAKDGWLIGEYDK